MKDARPIPLPEKGDWQSEEDVAAYACLCLRAAGLHQWRFGWDRAARRLGCCKPQQQVISLSCHFLRHYLHRDQQLIQRTILHELAHALAWARHKAGGHGEMWRSYCAALGIPGEKARCHCEDFAPASIRTRRPRYALCNKETGELFYRYKAKPRLTPQRLATAYIPGRKKETLGKLCIIPLSSPE